MAEQVLNHSCPNCAAPLKFAAGSGKLECAYCGSAFDPGEVDAMFREREERAARAKAENEQSGWNTMGFTEDWGSDTQSMKTYGCPSCGASLICDETTAASCCPYCGSQAVIPGQFSGALKPEYIIPFRTDKEAAIAALKEHYKGKRLLPKAFVSGNHIEEIQGVYVPFWLYDCTGEGRVTFHAEQTEEKETETEKIVTTKHYNVIREGSIAFEKVPADASKRMPDSHMDSIEPFDYSGLKPFSTAYMPGFLADKYDEDAEVCGKRMEERCRSALEESIDETVKGYDRVDEIEKNLVIKKGAVHYSMLPVWLLSTNWNGQSFLFAMNGQTGKLVGDLPVDKGKYWGYFAGISAALIAVMTALQFLAFHFETLLMIMVCVLLPVIIGFISVSAMKGGLKSVYTKNAKGYSVGGLRLSVKQDNYIRTTVKRTPKNQSSQQ